MSLVLVTVLVVSVVVVVVASSARSLSWRGFMTTATADESYTNFTSKQSMIINHVLETISNVTNESTCAADKSLCHLIVRGR